MVNVLSYILLPSFNDGHTIDPTFMKTLSRLLCRWIPGTPSTLQLERNESANLIELGVSPLPPLDPRSPICFGRNVGDDVSLMEVYVQHRQSHSFGLLMSSGISDLEGTGRGQVRLFVLS